MALGLARRAGTGRRWRPESIATWLIDTSSALCHDVGKPFGVQPVKPSEMEGEERPFGLRVSVTRSAIRRTGCTWRLRWALPEATLATRRPRGRIAIQARVSWLCAGWRTRRRVHNAETALSGRYWDGPAGWSRTTDRSYGTGRMSATSRYLEVRFARVCRLLASHGRFATEFSASLGDAPTENRGVGLACGPVWILNATLIGCYAHLAIGR